MSNKTWNSFDDPFPTDTLDKTITVYQDGKEIISITGDLKIIHESSDKIVFIDEEGCRQVIYNKTGVIHVEYHEEAKK